MSALLRGIGPSLEVVIAGDPAAEDTATLLAVIREMRLPQAAVLVLPSDERGDTVRRLAPFVESHGPVDGRAAAYVCRDFSCRLPTTDPAQLADMLEQEVAKPRAG